MRPQLRTALQALQRANAEGRHATLTADEVAAVLEVVAALASSANATLLFHSAAPWSPDKRDEWHVLTGSDSATTKMLCDVAREALRMLGSSPALGAKL